LKSLQFANNPILGGGGTFKAKISIVEDGFVVNDQTFQALSDYFQAED